MTSRDKTLTKSLNPSEPDYRIPCLIPLILETTAICIRAQWRSVSTVDLAPTVNLTWIISGRRQGRLIGMKGERRSMRTRTMMTTVRFPVCLSSSRLLRLIIRNYFVRVGFCFSTEKANSNVIVSQTLEDILNLNLGKI